MATLRDLGLSEYEARAYRGLLRSGAATAKELSRSSDVPMGRIYDVLNSLEQYGLVRSQTASRPKKYVAVEPEAALDRLLADRKRELEEKAEQYESVVDELSSELDAADPVDEQFWTAALGAEETVDLLLERLATADEEIVTVAGDPSLRFDLDEVASPVTDELAAALDRDVTVSVLLSREVVDALPEGVGRRYARELADTAGFEVRTDTGVDGSFTLIDGVEVCIEVPHPLGAGSPFAMIDLKDREFAAEVREAFDPRWEAADPLDLER